MFTKQEWLKFYDSILENSQMQAISEYIIKHCTKMIRTDDDHYYYILYLDRNEDRTIQWNWKNQHENEENNNDI